MLHLLSSLGIGRIWSLIRAVSRAVRGALILVSDFAEAVTAAVAPSMCAGRKQI